MTLYQMSHFLIYNMGMKYLVMKIAMNVKDIIMCIKFPVQIMVLEHSNHDYVCISLYVFQRLPCLFLSRFTLLTLESKIRVSE
jgi:hypothetical protein